MCLYCYHTKFVMQNHSVHCAKAYVYFSPTKQQQQKEKQHSFTGVYLVDKCLRTTPSILQGMFVLPAQSCFYGRHSFYPGHRLFHNNTCSLTCVTLGWLAPKALSMLHRMFVFCQHTKHPDIDASTAAMYELERFVDITFVHAMFTQAVFLYCCTDCPCYPGNAIQMDPGNLGNFGHQ